MFDRSYRVGICGSLDYPKISTSGCIEVRRLVIAESEEGRQVQAATACMVQDEDVACECSARRAV